MIMKVLEKGSLTISEDVFAVIAAIVIDEVEDIVSTVSHIKDDFLRVVNRKGNHKGIMIDQQDEKLFIDVKISVYLGTNIYELCKNLQRKIAEEIELMTGVTVGSVNVFVESVKVKS